MSRQSFLPREFGINLDRDDFIDAMVEEFSAAYRGVWSFDELLLHPREAARFCDEVRHKRHWYDLPDDIILRSVMIRRQST